jgi:hypothetical protein
VTHLWPAGEPLETWGDETVPAGFVWQDASHRILEVGNRLRVHTRWWEPGASTWREYLKVATDSGLLCLIYRELPAGGWFLARLYD